MEIQDEQIKDQGFKYDPHVLSIEFVKFYYTYLKSNPNLLIDSTGNFLFKDRSVYKIQGKDYVGQECILNTLINLKARGVNHEISNIDVLQSGLRRINILVTGKMFLDGFTYNFTEYFHIGCVKKNSDWFIQSSILRTL
ncbi:Nuclear transport factor 2 (NTF2) domain [seawater metagenome]|uniref:Nuclear transport factor 2 (NTF2) domain n=1 Tax=seawater metagenome TaxID=1561972 RepID=A0A5E8CMF3_9ZZZZ